MEELINENRYKLHLKRALLQAHLEIIDSAIDQHNRFVEDIMNLREPSFRRTDANQFDRYLRQVEDLE
jgi:hypothetical protein